MSDERKTGDRAGVRSRAAGFIGRHPSLVKMLGWLGIYNPGGSVNP